MDKIYKFVLVRYIDDDSKAYTYKTEKRNIHVGDYVVVKRKDEVCVGIVEEILYRVEKNAPYDVSKVKNIIQVYDDFFSAIKYTLKNYNTDSIFNDVENNTNEDGEKINELIFSKYFFSDYEYQKYGYGSELEIKYSSKYLQSFKKKFTNILNKININNYEKLFLDLNFYFNKQSYYPLYLVIPFTYEYFSSKLNELRNNNDDETIMAIKKLVIKMFLNGGSIAIYNLSFILFPMLSFTTKEKEFIIKHAKKAIFYDEFTTYVSIFLNVMDQNEANDIDFKAFKKLKRWGKKHLLSSMDIDHNMRDYIFLHGCENNLSTSFLASDVSNRINLRRYINENDNWDLEHFKGFSLILNGLSKSSGEDNILYLYGYRNILSKYLELYDLYKDNYLFYHTLCVLETNFYEFNVLNNFKRKMTDLIFSDECYNSIMNAINNNEINEDLFELIFGIHKDFIFDALIEKYTSDISNNVNIFSFFIRNNLRVDEIIQATKNNIIIDSLQGEPTEYIKYGLDLELIINELKQFPKVGYEFVLAGLKSKTVLPRKSALECLDVWCNMKDEDNVEDYLDSIDINLIAILRNLKKKEMIYNNVLIIDDIFGIVDDYDNIKFKEPIVEEPDA